MHACVRPSMRLGHGAGVNLPNVGGGGSGWGGGSARATMDQLARCLFGWTGYVNAIEISMMLQMLNAFTMGKTYVSSGHYSSVYY